MNLSPIEHSLLKAIEEFEVVDAHEHLPPEKVRLEQKIDVFTLFSQYTRIDLWASGMPKGYWEKIHDPAIPIEKRWNMFAPYLKYIKYGAHARPAFIAAKEIYGFEEINEKNYKALSERMSAENTPGIYHRILREKCKIRVALTQQNRTDYDLDLIVPLMPLDTYAAVRSKTRRGTNPLSRSIDELATNLGEKVETLDDYLEVIRKGLKKWKSEGVVGIKMVSSPYETPERNKAVAIFDNLMRNERKLLPGVNMPSYGDSDYVSYTDQLYSFLMEEMLDMAAEIGLVVAVHTGIYYRTYGGDFRYFDPQHMIPILIRHPNTKFDIYHMGVPYVREAVLMGKNFPNIWLNLTIFHITAPRIACGSMDDLIDLVPINKIIAFGGDYVLPVEKVYGHLVMARENIVKVLGRRIQEGLMTENEAIEIAKRWFYDNPKELYHLKI